MEKYNITPKKVFLHLKTILKHKWYVFCYCCKFKLFWQGIVHDLSKFSFEEFWTNVKYTRPGISPIEVQKNELGYALAWFHHKGRNKHHYVYWMDEFDRGCYVTRMPYKYLLEFVCDSFGACRAYAKCNKKNVCRQELKWWNKNKDVLQLHPDNKTFLDFIFIILAAEEQCIEEKKYDFDPFLALTSKYNLKEEYKNRCCYPLQVKIRQPEENK